MTLDCSAFCSLCFQFCTPQTSSKHVAHDANQHSQRWKHSDVILHIVSCSCMHRAMTMRTWNWLTHLVWDMRNAVHVGMCTMVWNGQLIIIFDVVISQVIIWIHAAFLLQPLTLHRHAHKGHNTMFSVLHMHAGHSCCTSIPTTFL